VNKIAIIGGGAAGTGAAWQLYKRLVQKNNAFIANDGRDNTSITLYERNSRVGGRAQGLTFAGCNIEVGGVLFHSSGKLTSEMMQFTGCKKGAPPFAINEKTDCCAFFTSAGFPVNARTSMASMASGIVKHVGIASSLRAASAASKIAKQYEEIYDQLIWRERDPFKTPDELFDALGLLEPTRISCEQYLLNNSINERMAYDIVEPMARSTYNQGREINALASLVGLAGAGLAKGNAELAGAAAPKKKMLFQSLINNNLFSGLSNGSLFVIDGGNWTLYDKVLRLSDVDVRTLTKVDKITIFSTPESKHPYNFRVLSRDGIVTEYDAVILAAPLALADIQIDLDGRPFVLPIHPYLEVQSTLVAGELNPEFFKQAAGTPMPNTIFVASSANSPFNHISSVGISPNYNCRIYKIFSANRSLTEEELTNIFNKVHEIQTHVWRGAYPVLTPGIRHLPFQIIPGLYFANALETMVSLLELETISGTNAANLCANYLGL
jgi:hypothetical protein